jgi:endonuclease/exonuclease/phosphatase (EEP) superfamily protein YafD
LVLASCAAWLAPLGWPFELFAHFRWQLTAAGAVLFAMLLVQQRPLPAALAIALACAHLATVLRTVHGEPAGPACDSSTAFRVVTANVQYTNRDHGRFLDWLAANPADLVVVQEVTGSWSKALGAAVPPYPYRREVVREDAYGIAVLSSWPMLVEPVDLAGDGMPSLLVTLQASDGPVRILALHTRWPITPALSALRDRSLDRAAGLVRADATRTLLVGDLNLSPYAPRFGRLLRKTSLRDALAAEFWRPTWHAEFWPLSLAIDHVLVPRSACISDIEFGPAIGSDHRPLAVSINWRR